MENYSVYRHINKQNGKQYIGITGRVPEERWGKDGSHYKNTPRFWSAICKYGWDGFEHEVLFSGLSKEEACELEIQLIRDYRTQDRHLGYNVLEGGTSPTITEEVRSKMSASMIGNKNGLGKKCSDEKKKKISDAQKGRSLTEEHRKHISDAKKGKSHRPLDQDSRRKISEAHEKTPVICTETGVVYQSIQDCARSLGLYATNICKCCKGKIKSTGGLHFAYYKNR